MREYTVSFRNGESRIMESESKSDLISQFFEDSEELFRREVVKLSWSSPSIHYEEEIGNSDKVHASVISADVNPYGWRKIIIDTDPLRPSQVP